MRRRSQPGFTLTELLLVIGIFVLLLAVAVPAFSSIARSSSEASALNKVARAADAARDLALRSPTGRDSAAVFFHEPGGPVTIVLCVEAGRITDQDSAGQPIERDVFVPSSASEPMQLPVGWYVNGFAPIGMIHDGDITSNTSGWYDDGNGGNGNYDASESNWVFPETAFYDRERGDAGRSRQTFMLRFEGGTGVHVAEARDPVLVLAPSDSNSFRTGSTWGTYRVDLADNYESFVAWVTAPKGASLGSSQLARKVLGDEATDTVLAAPVSQVVVYDSRRLLSALRGTRMNRDTQSFYKAGDRAEIDVGLFAPPVGQGLATTVTRRANEWLEHRLQINGRDIASDARVLSVDRYRGTMLDLTPFDGGS